MKKILSVLLAFAMVFSFLSSSVLAAFDVAPFQVKIGDDPLASKQIGTIHFTNPEEPTGGLYLVQVPTGTSSITVSDLQDGYAVSDSIQQATVESNAVTFPKELLSAEDLAGLLEDQDFQLAISVTNGDAISYKSNVTSDIIWISASADKDIPLLGILIQCGDFGGSSTADKTALNEQIARVTGESADHWYQAGDRYNGKAGDTISDKDSGFWQQFTAKTSPLVKAKEIAQASSPTQSIVDDATKALEAAIAKLIPTTQVNPTDLYESIQTYNGSLYTNPQSFSTISWTPFETARREAQSLLDSLFDSNGNPTEQNTSTNQHKLTDSLSNLQGTAAALDNRVSSYQQPDSESALDGIRLYAERYNLAKMIPSSYTAESWSSFISARTTALALLETNGRYYGGMGQSELQAQTSTFQQFRATCHGLVETKSSIQVTVSVTDNYVLRKSGNVPPLGATQTMTLKPDTSIGEVLAELKISNLNPSWESDVAVYLNGVAFCDSGSLNSVYSNPSQYSTAKLQDGDVLVISRIAPPIRSNISGLQEATPPNAVLEHIQFQSITPSKTTVKAGESFTVTVTAAKAMPTEYDGKSLPAKDTTIFVGAANADKTEAGKNPAINSTFAVTDANGKATVTLYDEGWCVLNAYDLGGAFGSLCNGASVLLYVEPAANVNAAKEALKTTLQTTKNAYPETFFTTADWQAIQTSFSSGMSAIEAAGSVSDARTGQLSSLSTITSIQKKAVSYNETNLGFFRNLMERLPNDLSKLDASVAGTITNLISRYDQMTGYQRQQLTQLELDIYNKVKAINTQGLPPAKEYQLKLEYDLSGIPEADQDGLNSMLTWLIENTAHEGKNTGDLGGEKMAALYRFHTTANSSSMGGTVFTPITGAYVGTEISLCVSPEYASHMQIRGNRNVTINGLPYNSTDYQSTISHDNWSIKDTSTAEVTNTTFSLKSSRVYTVNGTAYEMRGITVSGLDEKEVTSVAYGFFDFSDYLGKNPDNQTFISIGNSFRKFTMPYHDVTVTVKWAPVNGTNNEIAAAKEAAKAAIETAYARYNLSNYADNGTALTAAKNKGISDVVAATTLEQISEARKIAIAAMASIKPISDGTGSDIQLPDYGKVVGQIYINVENNTYPGGDFTGKILSSSYELCERDSMMTSVLKALAMKGYSWTGTGGTGYDISYLSSIYIDSNKNGTCDRNSEKKLGEFDGAPGSGWMGTLNDWFTNEGFHAFSVKNGKLENGDIVSILYTQNLGVDLGGTWGNSDTSLSSLKIDGGTLSPNFKNGVSEYALSISGDRATITVTPTASNKNYLVKTFLNTYNSDAAFYKRSESISVKSGDVIYVGVGEKSWPSMNNQGEEARDYTGTKYTIRVYAADANGIKARINALPDAEKITYSNYKNYVSTVEQLRKDYNVLSDNKNVDATRLIAAEQKISFFGSLDNVKTLLSAIPAVDKLTTSDKSKVQSAYDSYSKLSEEQRQYITLSDTAKYNAAIEWLKKQGIQTPGSIIGSSTMPNSIVIDPAVTINGSTATVTVTDDKVKDAIDAAKKTGEKTITIVASNTGSATSVDTTIPKTAVQSMVRETDAALLISTAMANVKIPNETLSSIIAQSKGSDLSIAVVSKSVNDVKDLVDAAKLSNSLILEVSIRSGNTSITSFDGKSLTLSLPATGNHTEGSAYQVIILSSGGKIETSVGNCVKRDGKLVVDVDTPHLSTFIVTQEKVLSFSDVAKDAWYYKAVSYVAEKGLVSGVGNDCFNPNGTLTRGMLVTILYRLENKPIVATKNSFTDVPSGTWYTDAVIWANKSGIASGYSKESFGPNDTITREQMSVMLMNYAKFKGYDTSKTKDLSEFSDVADASHWAMPSLEWSTAQGLVNGKGKGILDPRGQATRAEVSSILMRFCEQVEK